MNIHLNRLDVLQRLAILNAKCHLCNKNVIVFSLPFVSMWSDKEAGRPLHPSTYMLPARSRMGSTQRGSRGKRRVVISKLIVHDRQLGGKDGHERRGEEALALFDHGLATESVNSVIVAT